MVFGLLVALFFYSNLWKKKFYHIFYSQKVSLKYVTLDVSLYVYSKKVSSQITGIYFLIVFYVILFVSCIVLFFPIRITFSALKRISPICYLKWLTLIFISALLLMLFCLFVALDYWSTVHIATLRLFVSLFFSQFVD